MKIFVSLIPALAYALVTFISNIAGSTGETPKSTTKKTVISKPASQKETASQKNFVWVSNNAQNLAASEDSVAGKARKILN